jgi:hypothetical protein
VASTISNLKKKGYTLNMLREFAKDGDLEGIRERD